MENSNLKLIEAQFFEYRIQVREESNIMLDKGSSECGETIILHDALNQNTGSITHYMNGHEYLKNWKIENGHCYLS